VLAAESKGYVANQANRVRLSFLYRTRCGP
jgi:hypothetical protein